MEADIEVIAPTADRVAQKDGVSHTFRVNEVRGCDVVSLSLPSKGLKEGVRGPAAVDHKRINGFSYLLEHGRTQKQVYEMSRGSSTGQDGVNSVNSLGAAHADLYSANQVEFGQPCDAINARVHLQPQVQGQLLGCCLLPIDDA